MKIYRDLDYVRKRKRMATFTAVAGVALLGSAFFLASRSDPTGVFFAYIPLLAGTVIFHLGMQQVGKWSRAQRNDVVLDSLLNDLGERYSIIHYAKVGKRTVEHTLIHPSGVLAITCRELPGGVAYRDGRWRKVGQGLSRFFGLGGAFLGNPTSDTQSDVNALNELFTNEEFDVSTDGVIAFVNPRVSLDIVEPEFPVTNSEGLRPYISSLGSESMNGGNYLAISDGTPNYYQLLGVDPKSKTSVIESAYRRLAKKHHPDVAAESADAAFMRSLSEARACLVDPECRREYDESLVVVAPPTALRLQPAERQRILELLLQAGSFEIPDPIPTRRPVKRRAA